jgi:hypothetical protein
MTSSGKTSLNGTDKRSKRLQEAKPDDRSGEMTAPSVAEIISHHVKLSVAGIDRMYLNIYVPRLQCEYGVVQ